MADPQVGEVWVCAIKKTRRKTSTEVIPLLKTEDGWVMSEGVSLGDLYTVTPKHKFGEFR